MMRADRVLTSMAGIILLLSAASCEKRPEGVLSDSEMESLMTDLILADAYEQSAAGRAMPDSVRRHLGESVMKQHGVDYATLDSTYAWYARNLDDYYKMYTRVGKRVEQRRRKVAGAAADLENQLANDIWQQPRHMLFSPLATTDALVFEISGDAMQKGERLEWKMTVNGGADADMMIGVDYEDGTTSVTERTFHGDRRLSLSLAGDTARVPRRIYGVMRVQRDRMPLFADSIALLKQPFDSATYSNSWSQRLYHGPRQKELPKPVVKADSVSVDTVKPIE